MQVIIRPLEENDAYTSVKWRNDPSVFKYTGIVYKKEITIENELEWSRTVCANPNDYRCAIIVDGIYVGNIYLTGIDGMSAHYHVFIGNKEYWGKGVAKQASKLILAYAFNVLKLESVKLRVRKENISAFMLYEKLGFEVDSEDGVWASMSIKRHSICDSDCF